MDLRMNEKKIIEKYWKNTKNKQNYIINSISMLQMVVINMEHFKGEQFCCLAINSILLKFMRFPLEKCIHKNTPTQ